jgi:hypothetical protein
MGQPTRVGWRQCGQMRVATTALVPPMLSAIARLGKATAGVGDTPGDGGGGVSDDPGERELLEARRERFFVRSQLKALRRYREREAATGRPTRASDPRLAELEHALAELDEMVEGLRARLGRPHRSTPG